MSDALGRWLAALHDPDRAAEAVTDDVRIERYAPMKRGTHALAPVDVWIGLDATIAWLRRTPRGEITFELAGEPQTFGDRVEVEYRYRTSQFENGGVWLARLRDDKIARLQHRPWSIGSEPPSTLPLSLATIQSGTQQ